MLFLLITGSFLSIFLATDLFDISVLLSGILCVGLIAIGRREGYLIGLYNSCSYAILAYSNGLFGEVYLNLLFYVPTGIIGFLMWQRHTQKDRTVKMRQLRWLHRCLIASICLLASLGLGMILSLNPQQNNPFVDASTNVLSIVATFLMMWRLKEQWLLYILLNIVTIVMWTLRRYAGGQAGDLMILMWTIFLLNALFGAWRWNMGARNSCSTNEPEITEEALCVEA